MSGEWKEYWEKYRRSAVTSERDLFVQVGKTVNMEPIPDEMFRNMIERILHQLELRSSDSLLDICCGNGLVTKELAEHAKKITAIDFAEHLIIAAREKKAAPNIVYLVGDVVSALSIRRFDIPDRILMNDALAYFNPESLGILIDDLLALVGKGEFRFLATGIPNEDLKWNFYNTPKRRDRHLRNEAVDPDVNDGLGRWWAVKELEEICRRRGLAMQAVDQPQRISTFRMDVVMWRP